MWWIDFAVNRASDPENVPSIQRFDCAMNWSAMFQYSANHRLLGTQAATESMRNEVTADLQNLAQYTRATVVNLEKLNQLAQRREEDLERLPRANGGMLSDARED